jgi:hypothetical protein
MDELQESTPQSFSRSSFGADRRFDISDRTSVGAALWRIHVEKNLP